MTEVQRAAAEELRAGPRKGVKGPFIPLMRSPDSCRACSGWANLRFDSALPPRLSSSPRWSSRVPWTQQFEWVVHAPLALKAGSAAGTIDALGEGRRPASCPTTRRWSTT